MEGDSWRTVDRECEVCHREAVGFAVVPNTVHPDQRIVVCGECGAFVVDTLSDIGYFVYLAETGRLSL